MSSEAAPPSLLTARVARVVLSVLVPTHHLIVVGSAVCAVLYLAGPLRGPEPIIRWLRVSWALLILLSAGSLVLHRRCFLTTFENHLRVRAGETPIGAVPFLVYHLKRWPKRVSYPLIFLVRYGMRALVPLALWIVLTDLGLRG